MFPMATKSLHSKYHCTTSVLLVGWQPFNNLSYPRFGMISLKYLISWVILTWSQSFLFIKSFQIHKEYTCLGHLWISLIETWFSYSLDPFLFCHCSHSSSVSPLEWFTLYPTWYSWICLSWSFIFHWLSHCIPILLIPSSFVIVSTQPLCLHLDG